MRNQNLADPKLRAIDSEKFLKTFFSFGVRFENRISIYPTQILNNKMQTKHFRYCGIYKYLRLQAD